MRLRIKEKQVGDVTVVNLSGHLVMGESAQELKQKIAKMVAENKQSVLMNIDGLTYIDSCGVGELVSCLSTIKKSGGTMKLACPTEFVCDVLRITHLDSVLAPFKTQDEAMASFSDNDPAASAGGTDS